MRRLVVGSAILALTAATFSWTLADDQEIARKVAERLKQEQKEGNLRGFDINLKVAEGKVTLKGDVASAQQQKLALQAVRQIEGVEDVVNDLEIKPSDAVSDAGQDETAASSTPARTSFLSGLLSKSLNREAVSEGNQKDEAAASAATASDAKLAQVVAKALQKEKEAGNLKDFDIDLAVNKGVVVLDGKVSSAEQAQLAVQRSRDIEGVNDVINRLAVPRTSNPSTDASDAAAGAKEPPLAVSKVASADIPVVKQADEDRRIGATLSQRLQEAKQRGQLHGFGISMHVENGCVWLKGRVGSAAQQQLALDLARRTNGVRQVVNDLTVGEPPAKIAQNLTQRLRAAEADGSLQGTGLNVRVDGPDVWLTGVVNTPEQEELAVELARQVPGVRRVISGLNVRPVTRASQLALAAPAARMTSAPMTSAPMTSAPMTSAPMASAPMASAPMASATVASVPSSAAAIQFSRNNTPQSQPVAAPRPVESGRAQMVAAELPAGNPMGGIPLVAEMNASNPLPAATYAASMPVVSLDQTPRPLGMPQLASYAGAIAAAPLVAVAGAAGMAPAQLPGPGYAVVPARYDHPNLPGYAWPTYASYPNYAAVTYPKQYSPSAWPYIGPFYPYPQVPLGWRKVTLKWDDGWWNLDFKAK